MKRGVFLFLAFTAGYGQETRISAADVKTVVDFLRADFNTNTHIGHTFHRWDSTVDDPAQMVFVKDEIIQYTIFYSGIHPGVPKPFLLVWRELVGFSFNLGAMSIIDSNFDGKIDRGSTWTEMHDCPRRGEKDADYCHEYQIEYERAIKATLEIIAEQKR